MYYGYPGYGYNNGFGFIGFIFILIVLFILFAIFFGNRCFHPKPC